MRIHSVHVAWIALGVSVCAWMGIGYALVHMYTLHRIHTTLVADQNKAASLREFASHAQALADSTIKDRARLDTITGYDASSIIRYIETAGADAHVSAKVGQVFSGNAAGSSVLHATNVVVEVEGAFGNVLTCIGLLSQLPVSSTMNAFSMERMPSAVGTKGSEWDATITISFFTSSVIPL